MFDNLVESSSHKEDISRKGSFVIATAVIYGVLLVSFFVAGIYWYDNHLGEMELELTTLVAPVPVPQQKQEEVKQEAKPVKVEQNVDVRKELIAAVDESRLPPKEISAKASDIPPVRRGVTTVVGNESSNAVNAMPAGPGAGTVVSAPANRHHLRRPSRLRLALPFRAAFSMEKRSAYPSRRIHQSRKPLMHREQ